MDVTVEDLSPIKKKLGIADFVSEVADRLFAAAAAGPSSLTEGWAAAAAFTLQIYFDFSGYSDMAIGLALMFGLRKIPGSWNLRLSREAELEGIDKYCHGLPAYHMEFGQGLTYTTPTGGSESALVGAAAGAPVGASTDGDESP